MELGYSFRLYLPMNFNKYKDKTTGDIDGSNTQYNQLQNSNLRNVLEVSDRALIHSGIDPYNTIFVSQWSIRQEGTRTPIAYRTLDKK